MTQQEKKDAIIRALYKNHQLDLGVASSMGINDVIKEGGHSLPDKEVDLLGTLLYNEGLIQGDNYQHGYFARLTVSGIKEAEWLMLEDARFNLYLEVNNGSFNLFDLDRSQANKVATAYKQGLSSVTLNHKTYYFREIHQIAFFTNEHRNSSSKIEAYLQQEYGQDFGDITLNADGLAGFGKDVTSNFLADEPYGYEKKLDTSVHPSTEYIHTSRIDELKAVNSSSYDVAKLIRICEELNNNHRMGNFISIILLSRAIINHVPPLFGNFTTFDQVIGQYGNKSFKNIMKTLNESLRSTADNYNHQLIRHKEPLPTLQQVDYRANLDILLSEILVILHTNS